MTLTATFMDTIIGIYSTSYALFEALNSFSPEITDPTYEVIKQDTPELWELAYYVLLDTTAGTGTIKITVTSL